MAFHLNLHSEPFFDLHLSGPVVHHVGHICQHMTPFFSGMLAGDPDHQIGTGIQLPLAESPGIGIDNTHGQGIGRIVEIIVRIVFQEPADILLGKPLDITPQPRGIQT